MWPREAAEARNALPNYVGRGNKIQSPDNFITLTCTLLQSIKVFFIEFDKTMLLRRKKMTGIDIILASSLNEVWKHDGTKK